MTTSFSDNNLAEKYQLDKAPKVLNSDLIDIFERGVLSNVRVSAERFGFTLGLSDLGLVPTRENKKAKTQAAINSVLRSKQRATLLPRDEMWYIDASGNRLQIPRFENTERTIRMLFPTRFDQSTTEPQDESEEVSLGKPSSMVTTTSLWAVPMNGMTFVPESSFLQWKSELDRAVLAHKQVAQIICENYDRLRVASVRHYEQIALDVFNRLRQTSPETIVNVTALDFIRRWKRAVLNAWPTKEEIVANFSVDVNYYWAPLPSRIQQDRALRDEIVIEATQKREDRRVAKEISSLVSQSQGTQMQSLTVSYVRTLLERTESVFFNFLQFLNDSERSPSTTQLNTIMKVVEMINVMGSGISSFDQIRDMANNIEEIIAQHKLLHANVKDRKSLSESLRQPNAVLPEALANAIELMRTEVEAMVGKEGRRTIFTDQNPFDICNEMWGLGDLQSSVRIISEDADEIDDDLFAGNEEEIPVYRNIAAIV